MPGLFYVKVFVAALSIFLLGGFWYSERGFLKIWQRESGTPPIERHGAAPFVFSFVFALVAAFLFGAFAPHETLYRGLVSGAVVGAGWVGTSFGINYQFGGKSLALLLVDGGYHVIQFLIFGLIFGAWH